MLIEVSNTLTVENPTPEMVLWCKRNLTIPNPEYAKKSRMNLWLGNTPKVLSLYETRGTTLVLPFGTLRLSSSCRGSWVDSRIHSPLLLLTRVC